MGKSLKGYEFTNLLFFLVLIVVLAGGCWWVFYHIGTKDRVVVVDAEPGIASEQTTGDITLFYLEGFHIVGSARTYRSRLEIPSTDDGLVRDLFGLPGLEEIVIEPQLIIVKKNGTVSWNKLSQPIRDIIKNHLHSHY
ncbi:MAG: NifU N-terminal domain-containing protein [Acidobacteriota bacterium]|nr:NifU N-terminal domain-containing protein [Acidobacteriota bacterium]